MTNNSLYNSLTTDTIINEIRLTLSATPNVPFIIVEGDDDLDFFQHHCPNNVIIRESYTGKQGVYQILEMYTNKNSVIGICDRDYDNEPLPVHVFSYDFCCLETMLFSNITTSEIVFRQLGLIDKISLKRVLHQLSWLSYVRKINYIEDLGIRFEGLSIPKLFECTCGLHKDKLIARLNELNNTSSLLNENKFELVERCTSSSHTIEDLLFITQGHDLISLIQCYHAYYVKYKGRTMSESDIRALLYCTYVEKFKESKMYSDIFAYGLSVNIHFLLRAC